MPTVFVAYASGNRFHAQLIEEACAAASTGDRIIKPWSQHDTSGSPIAQSVETWIEAADAFVADISIVNENVTYELGFAIGQRKPVRLIRSSHLDFGPTKAVALLDTLGHDSYDFASALAKILAKPDETTRWSEVGKNKDQPMRAAVQKSATVTAR